ncbi:MAG TPA: glycosyltransferase [Burkholderiaceae bacterium]
MTALPPVGRRLAVVVQRFGDQINGGAEAHARLLVRALSPHAQIDVLTSRALDYREWKPVLPAGIESRDGVRVIRFDHASAQRGRARHTPLKHKVRFKLRRWLPADRPRVAAPRGDPASDGERFLAAQGPTMPGLIEWLAQRGSDYAALLFMTARFHPSAMGVFVNPGRSILIPTLHDEKAMYLPYFHRVFRAPHQILYNTAAEQRLAHRLYGPDLAPGSVCGIGIDLPDAQALAAASRAEPMGAPYLLYLGRVDRGKGCDELFRHFTRWLDASGQALRLVVAGQLAMPKPRDPRIECVGFVDEPTKWRLLCGATALVIPSRHESLSMVLLEALAVGTTVIANRDSEVLADHLAAAQMGFTYGDENGFRSALRSCLERDPAARAAEAARGRQYVEQHYAWPVVTAKLLAAIERIEDGRSG